MRRLYRVPRALMTVLVVDVMCGCERSSGPQWSRAVPGVDGQIEIHEPEISFEIECAVCGDGREEALVRMSFSASFSF